MIDHSSRGDACGSGHAGNLAGGSSGVKELDLSPVSSQLCIRRKDDSEQQKLVASN